MAFGRYFEEFEEGALLSHWPGRTINEADDTWFSLLTMNQHPVHIDAHYAKGPGSTGNRDQLYREEFLVNAWVLPLGAGEGLHFPLHAPHWVKTESETSISLSITFRSRRSKAHEAIHAANGHVRRLGMVPPEPGASRLWDSLAHAGYRGYRSARALAGRIRRRLRRF